MPVQYAGVTEEHLAVRTHAGLFDVSHMGEIEVEGPEALAVVQRTITNDAGRLAVGQGLYSPMCTPSGGIVDDVTVFRTGDRAYLYVVNASTRSKDVAWIRSHAERRDAAVRDVSDSTALLALQGPRARGVCSAATGVDLSGLAPFHLRDGVVIDGIATRVFHTGYTGEDGFEIACPWDAAPRVWTALLKAGRGESAQPVGLGARDTLRLEAALMLYGNDIDETTSPLEAPLAWTVKFEKGDFSGRDALLRQRAAGVTRRLVGFEVTDRAIPRQHCPIEAGGQVVGEVTSGSFAPFLKRPLGMGYVPTALAAPGTPIRIDVRGKRAAASVVKLPFYRRKKT
jgi:aminomethyltransferase